jgi:hypothetical protein
MINALQMHGGADGRADSKIRTNELMKTDIPYRRQMVGRDHAAPKPPSKNFVRAD